MENKIRNILKHINKTESDEIFIFGIVRPSATVRLFTSIFASFFVKNYICCFGEHEIVVLDATMNGNPTESYRSFLKENIEKITLKKNGLYYLLSIKEKNGQVFALEVPGRYGMRKWHNEGFKKIKELYYED